MSPWTSPRGWSRGEAAADDGTSLAYWTAGNGDPLVLIAGQSLDHTSWRIAVELLLPGRRLIVFDHRGVGHSGAGTPDRFDTRSFAGDVRAVLDATGVARADVLGHSMGGRIAQWLAIDHPERVRRVVLASTSAGDAHGSPRTPDADDALRSGDRDRIAQVFFTRHPGWFAHLLAIEPGAAIRSRHRRASRRHDALDELHRIGARTLILHGEADCLVPLDHARTLHDRIPLAELAVLRGARHGIVVEGGPAVRHIERFLSPGRSF
ncbi:alpha/beta fold hydrolase [Microbacterium album]|uniref:Dihydrolipoamide acetyltransferase n=1 Tax=Microbacterium album TaxID=2053191 RepID=A0A917ML93_9MICO|nr:alpha/beta fold hydrolase [Microbacterium album]GGH36845.1 dihydrolipoamide acetyltransferase [Microbacterium album]